jgi:hypothetical protein
VGKPSVFEVCVADAFNPYSQWLGIETGRPPNHYELLRIAPFEADLKVIAAAAATQMAKIRGIRPGPRAADWQRVLDELAAAKDCLTDHTAKARYDEQLRERGKRPATAERSDGAGKNVLPPSTKSAVLKRAEASSTTQVSSETSLNPLPPGRSAKPSSSASPATNPKVTKPSPAAPRATPLPMPQSQQGAAAVSSPGGGAASSTPGVPTFPRPAPGGFPNRPLSPQGGPVPAMPFPGSLLPGSPFSNMPCPGTTVPGAAMTGGQAAQAFAGASGVSSAKLPVASAIATHETAPAAETPAVEWTGGAYVHPIKRKRARQNSSHIALIGVGIAVGVALAVGVGIVINKNRHGADSIADVSPSSSSTGTTGLAPLAPAINPAVPQVKPSDPPKPNPLLDPHGKSQSPAKLGSKQASAAGPLKGPPMKEPAPSSPPENPLVNPTAPAPEPPTPTPVDPVQAAKLHRALVAARAKLGERNLDAAKQQIATATQLAVTPEQHDEVDRYDALEKYVGEFWSAVRDSIKNLKATDEIDLGSTKVIVVEAGADALTIHVGGANRRYQVNQLPSGLAVGLALRWLDPMKPENKVFVGAFYLVDPKTGPEQAKQAWDEAAAAGVDVKNLLPLLQPDAADAVVPETDSSHLAVVPDMSTLAKAEKKVHDEMDAAFAAAVLPSQKNELTKKLIENGLSADDPVRRYALWCAARDWAAEAGQPAMMIEAVDRLAGQYRIDPLDMKADAMANFPPKSTTVGRSFNEAALKLAEVALAANRRGLADRFVQIALTAAKATNSVDLVRRTQQRAKEVQELGDKSAPGT